jgi:hypothetical protein
MSEVKHAREPWSLGAIENQAQGGKMQMINSLEHGGLACVWITTDGIDSPKNKANAERIVACVNACEGLSTDWLQNSKVIDVFKQDAGMMIDKDSEIKELQSRLEVQRAETKLLKHQQELSCCMSNQGDTQEVTAYRELVAKLRIAIRWARLSDNEWINFRVLEDMLDGALPNGD